ncbi:putative S-adenosyl-L-methionine-dependent methyltransferase [Raoultella planticola]|uniref:Putative S-adenosyl-L-methionine-dependent methyltransferase n=1 Tax=Raoultella planticola TaxID=575 RepID=A0A485C8S5_RAOPL|nr:putative S-adenosyl-L-methionine-dependent methyltransferase [Raoultella planticola]
MTWLKSFRAIFTAPPRANCVRPILWQDLQPLLSSWGQGRFGFLTRAAAKGKRPVKVAEMGHHVTLCDLSAEMVARARQAAADKGVIDNMHFVQCAAQDIAQHLESPVDLILFHAVLEWVAEPQEMLRTLWSVFTTRRCVIVNVLQC